MVCRPARTPPPADHTWPLLLGVARHKLAPTTYPATANDRFFPVALAELRSQSSPPRLGRRTGPASSRERAWSPGCPEQPPYGAWRCPLHGHCSVAGVARCLIGCRTVTPPKASVSSSGRRAFKSQLKPGTGKEGSQEQQWTIPLTRAALADELPVPARSAFVGTTSRAAPLNPLRNLS